MAIHTDKAIWEAETEGLELLDLTIGDLLDQQAAVSPDTEALVYNSRNKKMGKLPLLLKRKPLRLRRQTERLS